MPPTSTDSVDQPAESSPREILLRAAVAHLAASGIGDQSLRQIAASLGTSHRMLIYHFGSKTGLLAEVVASVERVQAALLDQMVQGPGAPPGALSDESMSYWDAVTRAADSIGALTFELAAHVMQGEVHAKKLRTSLVETYLQPLTRLWELRGHSPEVARRLGRMHLAVARGLVFDYLITGDESATREAIVPTTPAQLTPRSIDIWKRAFERGQASALGECLSEGVQLISPLTDCYRFHGRAAVGALYESAFEVLEDMRVHTTVTTGSDWVLIMSGRSGSVSLEEAQLLRLDDDGQIDEITIFGRPLPALTTVMAALGPKLVRGQGRRGFARFLTATGAPLAWATRFAERRLVPKTDPASQSRT